MGRMILTQTQWKHIDPILAKVRQRKQRERQKQTQGETENKGGRPQRKDKEVFEGILWVLLNRRPWRELPERYPNGATCFRRLQKWRKTPGRTKGKFKDYSVWDRAWRRFLAHASEPKWDLWQAAFGKLPKHLWRSPSKKKFFKWQKAREKTKSQRIDDEWISRCGEIMDDVAAAKERANDE